MSKHIKNWALILLTFCAIGSGVGMAIYGTFPALIIGIGSILCGMIMLVVMLSEFDYYD